ncbi:alpha/beta hydrolase [Thermospira aquatica]|uniref:Alpha/beta fold hydrolase n=1 Tax=Thermospira aquatica TaxID=2828656 RepID=A0AAX3BDV6_9SPIR|nr:alpha/beta fold hydrolase [Thermospira aquatica]URA10507.1 alpha/beta fold hydrolase [Thermospira aquatica]
MRILPGFEPFSFQGKGDEGVLLIHGFTGSTTSIREWGEYLAKSGYHVESPRLSGHGTRWQDVNRYRVEDWLLDVEDAYHLLKSRVRTMYVAGLSMGGLLALAMAEEHPEIKAIVLVNHALEFYPHPLLPLVPILRFVLPSVPAISSDIKDPNIREIAYDRTPVNGVYQVRRLQKMVSERLSQITQPLLIFKSREDHVLPVSNVEKTISRVSSSVKEVIWLENSYHVATQDYDKHIIFERSVEFLKRIGGHHG